MNCICCGKPAPVGDVCNNCISLGHTIIRPDDMDQERRRVLRDRFTQMGFDPEKEIPEYDHDFGAAT